MERVIGGVSSELGAFVESSVEEPVPGFVLGLDFDPLKLVG